MGSGNDHMHSHLHQNDVKDNDKCICKVIVVRIGYNLSIANVVYTR